MANIIVPRLIMTILTLSASANSPRKVLVMATSVTISTTSSPRNATPPIISAFSIAPWLSAANFRAQATSTRPTSEMTASRAQRSRLPRGSGAQAADNRDHAKRPPRIKARGARTIARRSNCERASTAKATAITANKTTMPFGENTAMSGSSKRPQLKTIDDRVI